MEYITFIVGRNTEIHLPKIDITWSGIHNEKPFMLYPGETCKEYIDDSGKKYCISNYCRVWNYKSNDFVKGIGKKYMPKIFRDNFSEDELDNEITRHNMTLHIADKEKNHNYYMRNRDKILGRQHEYYNNNRDKVLERQREYYINNRESRIAYQHKYDEAKRQAKSSEHTDIASE